MRIKNIDPRTSPPIGYHYDCIVTPRPERRFVWYDGLGRPVDVFRCLLAPREADRDGSCYLFRPNKDNIPLIYG